MANISNDAIENEFNRPSQTEKKATAFDEKNYLNTRLSPSDNGRKEVVIRILPIAAGSSNPFEHVFTHTTEVHKELAPNTKPGKKPTKTYICLNSYYNKNINHDVYGNDCPFCQARKIAYEKLQNAKTPIEKKALEDEYKSYRATESIIIRCIERGKENEGVKFWKFNTRFDKADPWNKLLNLYNKRKNESIKATGHELNILDERDITLTITQGNLEGTVNIDVMDSSFNTPLSDDPKQAEAWLNDTKVWQDVFGVKPYDYLKLAMEKKYPWKDKTTGKWIDREESNNAYVTKKDEANKEIEEAEKTYTSEPDVTTIPEPQPIVENVPPTNNDDDLPF